MPDDAERSSRGAVLRGEVRTLDGRQPRFGGVRDDDRHDEQQHVPMDGDPERPMGDRHIHAR